jgi:orotidine-5'-phosphate decarboxylase
MTEPIIALDVPSTADAMAMVGDLGELCGFYKVGTELFTAAGPDVVRRLMGAGKKIFLDLKLHDIPNTVEAAARSAARVGASLLTVHASGGDAMMRAAVSGAGEDCGILAVTVLTSLDERSVARAWGRTDLRMEEEVLRLAGQAFDAGLHGVVCSGREVKGVRDKFGGGLAPLVPGIRFAGGAEHDQSRVVTPGQAAASGARYIVVGRAVTGERRPREAMARIWSELNALT